MHDVVRLAPPDEVRAHCAADGRKREDLNRRDGQVQRGPAGDLYCIPGDLRDRNGFDELSIGLAPVLDIFQ